MRYSTASRLGFAAACGLMLPSCSYHEYKETKEVPAPASTTTIIAPSTPAPAAGVRTYDLVDPSGYRYGTARWDSYGHGRLYDNDGALIGDIVPPR